MSATQQAALAGTESGPPEGLTPDKIASLRRPLAEHWPPILRELGVPAAAFDGRPSACPSPHCHAGADGFQWHGSTFTCQSAAGTVTGDGLALLAHVHGWTLAEAARRVAEALHVESIAVNGRTLTEEEQRQYLEETRQRLFTEAADTRRQHERMASSALWLWELAKPVQSYAPLAKAGVEAHGLRSMSDMLLAPMRDEFGRIWNLWQIDGSGQRRAFRQGRHKGLFHLMGYVSARPRRDTRARPPIICVAEDYRGAATAYEATGHPAACTFGAENLEAAAVSVACQYPGARIIVCAYMDREGMTRGQQAATAVGGWMIAPWPAAMGNESTHGAVRAAFQFLEEGLPK